MSAVSLPWAGPPAVSVLPEGPVRVKVGKAITLECVGAGEPRSSARWTRLGTPASLEQQVFGLVDSHTLLQVRRGFRWPEAKAVLALGLRPSQGPSLSRCLEEGMLVGQVGDEWKEREREGRGRGTVGRLADGWAEEGGGRKERGKNRWVGGYMDE